METSKIDLVELFKEKCRAIAMPDVLELGTLRIDDRPSTLRTSWVPHAQSYTATEQKLGPDVDLAADLHQLADQVGEERYDAIISCSTLEHVKYPHLAAHQIMRTLRVGGLIFI